MSLRQRAYVSTWRVCPLELACACPCVGRIHVFRCIHPTHMFNQRTVRNDHVI